VGWAAPDLSTHTDATTVPFTKVGTWKQSTQVEPSLLAWGDYVAYRFTATEGSRVGTHPLFGIVGSQGAAPSVLPAGSRPIAAGFVMRTAQEAWGFNWASDMTASTSSTTIWKASPDDLAAATSGIKLTTPVPAGGTGPSSMLATSEGLLFRKDVTTNGVSERHWSLCSFAAAPLCSHERQLGTPAEPSAHVVGPLMFAASHGEIRSCSTAAIVSSTCTWQTVAKIDLRDDYPIVLKHDLGSLYVMGTPDGSAFGLWRVSL
jgi:hypothetical protein